MKPLSREELLALPPVIGVEQAGRAIGLHRQRAYHLIQQGKFPVPVHWVGHRYKIPTDPILDFLGVKRPDHSQDTPGSTSSGEADNSRAISPVKELEPNKLYRVTMTGTEVAEWLAKRSVSGSAFLGKAS